MLCACRCALTERLREGSHMRPDCDLIFAPSLAHHTRVPAFPFVQDIFRELIAAQPTVLVIEDTQVRVGPPGNAPATPASTHIQAREPASLQTPQVRVGPPGCPLSCHIQTHQPPTPSCRRTRRCRWPAWKCLMRWVGLSRPDTPIPHSTNTQGNGRGQLAGAYYS